MWNMRVFRCLMWYGKSCKSGCNTSLCDFIHINWSVTLSFRVRLNPVCIGGLTGKGRLWAPCRQNAYNSRYCVPTSHTLSLILNKFISVTFLFQSLCYIHWPFVELFPFPQTWFSGRAPNGVVFQGVPPGPVHWEGNSSASFCFLLVLLALALNCFAVFSPYYFNCSPLSRDWYSWSSKIFEKPVSRIGGWRENTTSPF